MGWRFTLEVESTHSGDRAQGMWERQGSGGDVLGGVREEAEKAIC